MPTTVTASDARSQFPRIAQTVSETGEPVTVFKNSRPWVIIQPASPTTLPQSTRQAMQDAEHIAKTPRFTQFEDLMTALDQATHAED